MPGLRLHMTLARDLANDLGSPVVDAARGAYFLGATTPDIRVLTRWDRERTHFFSLAEFAHQDGVHRLFEQEPTLRDAHAIDAPTAAFVAGYISHLVMDEDYICQVYRPLFGEKSDLNGDGMADVMDKALQWDIERAEYEDTAKVGEIRAALGEAAVEVNIGFIAGDTLAQWRDLSLDMIGTPPTVDRLVRFLGRRMPEFQFDDEASAARFAETIPDLLRRTWAHVGEERVREYLDSSRRRALASMKEYLT